MTLHEHQLVATVRRLRDKIDLEGGIKTLVRGAIDTALSPPADSPHS